MKKYKFSSHLRLFFIIAVVIPCAFLAVIAIRSINREEAYIEKRFEGTLLAELTHVVTLMNSELDSIREELHTSAPVITESNIEASLSNWKNQSALVSVPFLLSPEYEILWPKFDRLSSGEELAFLNWNREFITNVAEIPVYQNIALANIDQISLLEKSAEATGRPREEQPAEADLVQSELSVEGLSAVADEEKKALPPQPGRLDRGISTKGARASGKDKRSSPSESVSSQQKALMEFEKSENVRKEVYEQAKKKGQQTSPRTVIPSARISKQKMEPQQQESIYISEPRRFNDIIAGKALGIIPRFIEDKLTLFFWRKDEKGRIIGCVIDENNFRDRIIGLLPNIFSQARVLTILDENGRPLITPDGNELYDWRRPFTALEISELLPRWEVAAYLTDPDSIASRANFTAMVMWVLILVFFVSIVSGGTYVLNTLRSEIDLAKKKTSFVANVSHELKTPLTSIRMFAEMLKEKRQPDKEKQKEYLNIMVSETERLTRLINNVLDFSRMEKSKKQYNMKKVDVAFLCEDIVESQRVRLEHNGFEVSFRNDLGTAFILGDEEALKQAILNLFSNAEKYSREKKEVDMELSRTEDSVLINIKDRGVGIPSQEAKKIFKEFYRVDESLTSKVRGSGLGLTIALRIVQDHGGDILYFPRDGGGSVFQIRFPIKGES